MIADRRRKTKTDVNLGNRKTSILLDKEDWLGAALINVQNSYKIKQIQPNGCTQNEQNNKNLLV